MLMLLRRTLASAEQGVFEINPTCALQTGCFPGDTPGFPVTIASRGSDRLTSDLAISGSALSNPQNITAVQIGANPCGFDTTCP